jgi:hypothetical protein
MMPLAVLLLIAELKLMAWLVTTEQPAKRSAAAGSQP